MGPVRLWPKHWHPETWVCSMRGHVAPARWAATVGDADVTLGVELADGRRLARCLRCDCWIEHPVPAGAAVRYATLPPIADLPHPRRGPVLHQAIFMRVIALNKALHASVFTILAITVTLLETNLTRLHRWSGRIVTALTNQVGETGQGASQSWLERELKKLFDLRPGTLRVLLALALVYAVLEWAEAIGLWLERRWAEYLTVIATAGFLPLEVHELVKRVTALRVVALVVNVALVVWLLWAKHLFGLRGGAPTLEAENEIDWDRVLAEPQVAQGRVPVA
jgi:uncharacterized membrane protein (DUF2068 family)